MKQIISDLGLVLINIGGILVTILIWMPFFQEIIPLFHLSILSMGWILYIISLVLINITKNQYHIISLHNGFLLKIDHLIICVWVIVIFFSYIIAPYLFFSILWQNGKKKVIFSARSVSFSECLRFYSIVFIGWGLCWKYIEPKKKIYQIRFREFL